MTRPFSPSAKAHSAPDVQAMTRLSDVYSITMGRVFQRVTRNADTKAAAVSCGFWTPRKAQTSWISWGRPQAPAVL